MKMEKKISSSDGTFRRVQLATFSILFAGYGVYNYTRKAVSFALPSLMKNQLLDKSGAGTISSCQNLAYAISKFAGGVLSDKISAKWLFFSGLILSGVATLLFSLSSSLTMFAICLSLNGFAQGAGWPACAKMLKKWFSPEQFGTFWSGLSASSNLSGSLCPLLAAWIISQTEWRVSLVVAGVAAMACALIVMILLRESPTKAGFQADFSQTSSSSSSKKDDDSASKSMTWKDLITSPFLQIVSVCYLVVFAAKTSVSDWGQMFIIEDLGLTPFVGSAFTSSVETGGFFGGIAAGSITDFLMKKRFTHSGNPRMFAAIWFMAGVAGFLYLLTNWIDPSSPQILLTCIGFALGACLYACIAIFGIVASESYPAHLSGTAHAIVALAANVGAILSGLPCSYIAQIYSWRSVFIILQILAAATTVMMIACRRVSPIKMKERTD